MSFKRGHIVKNKYGNVGYVALHTLSAAGNRYHVKWQFANGHYLGMGEFMTMETDQDLDHHSLNYNEKVLYNNDKQV